MDPLALSFIAKPTPAAFVATFSAMCLEQQMDRVALARKQAATPVKPIDANRSDKR